MVTAVWLLLSKQVRSTPPGPADTVPGVSLCLRVFAPTCLHAGSPPASNPPSTPLWRELGSASGAGGLGS